MINPQSLTLKEAYDPFVMMEKVLFVRNAYNGRWTTLSKEPDASAAGWIWAFDFDHDSTLVHVVVYGFKTMDEAYYTIINGLYNHPKMLRIGGITEVCTQAEYAAQAIGEDYDYFIPGECD